MANAIPATTRKALLDGDVDLLNDTVKATLVKTAYTYSSAHDFIDDVTAGNRIATVTLASKTTTAGAFDSADPTWTSVAAGSTIGGIWLWVDSGTESTSRLVAWYDTNAASAAISVATNGGNVTVTVNASGWFTI